jgi:toxin-antitoxin system PIN domain toxin
MIALDTNILVHAHRSDSTWHDAAMRAVGELAEGRDPWAVAWPCIHEFIAIVTHPGIYRPPSPLDVALEQVDAWKESPSLVLLSEADGYWHVISETLRSSRVEGPRVHDARVAALCLQHGITELWTADRDFGRFPELRVRNPLL